jgi:hypothetical protein
VKIRPDVLIPEFLRKTGNVTRVTCHAARTRSLRYPPPVCGANRIRVGAYWGNRALIITPIILKPN